MENELLQLIGSTDGCRKVLLLNLFIDAQSFQIDVVKEEVYGVVLSRTGCCQ